MLGFSAEELRNKHCVDFSPREDAEKDWAFFQKLRARAIDHYQLEKRYVRRDGSIFWGNLTVSLLNGRPSPLVIAMVQDITEKKTSEEARFRHAAIVRSSQDAIISMDASGVIVSWNAGAELIYEYTEAEALGQPITILYPPELRDQECRILEKLSAGEPIEHYESVRVTKTGRKVEVSLWMTPVRDSAGTISGFTKIAHTIIGRKQAERLLRQTTEAFQEQAAALRALGHSEDLLKIFVKNVPAGVAMLDREMRYLQVSERFCQDYSIDSSRVLGRSHYELFPDMPKYWKDIHRQVLEGATFREDEERWERESGTQWVRWEVLPWRGSDGTIGGILIFAEDITRRKQMEEALSEVSAKLIESQEQERARIGRELHDDINQRLALLAVDLDQLETHPSELNSRTQKLRGELADISNDIQALSHELHSSKLEYLGVVDGIRSCCVDFAARQGMPVSFASDVSSSLSLQVGICLLRVLQESLHNAVKHSGTKQIEVKLAEHSGAIHLTVRDSGNGFNVDAAKRGAAGSG